MAFGKQNSSGDSEYDREELAEINMIPLIDVMLVLLIIFMVAAPLSISGIKIDLPTSKAKGGVVDTTKVVLSIDDKGKYFLGKMELSEDNLSLKFKTIFANREEKALYIRADKRVAYGRVVDAMSAAKLAGINKIAMLTTPPTSK